MSNTRLSQSEIKETIERTEVEFGSIAYAQLREMIRKGEEELRDITKNIDGLKEYRDELLKNINQKEQHLRSFDINEKELSELGFKHLVERLDEIHAKQN